MTKTSLKIIITALTAAEVRYLIVGGLAVVAHGYVRCTVDVDLLLQMDDANVARAVGVLGRLGYVSKTAWPLADFADSAKRLALRRSGVDVLRLRSPAHDKTEIDLLTRDALGFDRAYGRRLDCELDGIILPVCGYDDLVTLKRLADRSHDGADIAQLEKVRSQPTPAERDDPWFAATFEGCELDTLRRSAAWAFAVKIAQLEEMHDLARKFQEARRTMGGGRTIRASGLIEDV